MGLFDKILKGLGFQDDESEEKPKPVKKQQKKVQEKPVFASFDLNKEETKPQEMPEEIVDEPVVDYNEQKVSSSQSLNVIKVSGQEDVQDVILKIKQGESLIINMSDLSSQDLIRSLDFLTGALFALEKPIQKIDDAIFLVQ